MLHTVKGNLALSKFNSLIDLQKLNGSSISNSYTSHAVQEEMVAALNQATLDRMLADINAANFVSIMCDESVSVDIAVHKKLIVFLQIVKAGEIAGYYGKNIDIPDGKANTIYEKLKKYVTEELKILLQR